jgi:hypothetical protein
MRYTLVFRVCRGGRANRAFKDCLGFQVFRADCRELRHRFRGKEDFRGLAGAGDYQT